MSGSETHWSQQKRISDHNTEKTPILWPHLPDEGHTNVKSHSVWCDGGQLHGKGDHVENGRMISRIGASKEDLHTLRWKATDRAEWQRVVRHAIDTNR